MSAGWRRCGSAALWLSLLFWCGCGSSTGRRPLHGRVEVDGVAVTSGSISFLPAPGNSGPAANAVIEDGEYRFTEDSGPCSGPHRVLIDVDSQLGGDKKTGPKGTQDVKRVNVKAMGAGAGRPRTSQATAKGAAISHWEVEYTVPEDGQYRKDFDLPNDE